MSDKKKRVNPSEAQEIDDEALESVAGGCQMGCSNQISCMDFISMATCPDFTTITSPTTILG
jgi:hypothetical protein